MHYQSINPLFGKRKSTMFLYMHDEEKKMLYAVPSEPIVRELKDGRKQPSGWSVSVEIQISRPDNYILKKTGQWRFPVCLPLHDRYMLRDSREDVIRYFRMNHYPKGKLVSREEFDALKRAYDASCANNGEQY